MARTSSAKFTMASAATTAVSVRKIFSPSDASRNPQLQAAPNSLSVQPPSGPMASAMLSSVLSRKTLRNGGAFLSSDKSNLMLASASGNASAALIGGAMTGGFKRRD